MKGEMQIPVGKGMLWQEDMSWKVVGLNPGAGKGDLLMQSL